MSVTRYRSRIPQMLAYVLRSAVSDLVAKWADTPGAKRSVPPTRRYVMVSPAKKVKPSIFAEAMVVNSVGKVINTAKISRQTVTHRAQLLPWMRK